jgi:hypothetical protein
MMPKFVATQMPRAAMAGKLSHTTLCPLHQLKSKKQGAKFFNLLPAELRNTDNNTVNIFKKKLDIFLANIPDQPTIAGMGRYAESNSLLHQIPQSMLNILCY